MIVGRFLKKLAVIRTIKLSENVRFLGVIFSRASTRAAEPHCHGNMGTCRYEKIWYDVTIRAYVRTFFQDGSM